MEASTVPTDAPEDERPTVLIADDDGNSAAFLVAVVRKLGYHPVWVSDGQVAFERAKTLQPKLIMMDLLMPGFDGLTSIRLLRLSQATNEIPIIVISGLDAANHAAKCKEAGAAGFLSKPLTADQVRTAMREAGLNGR